MKADIVPYFPTQFLGLSNASTILMIDSRKSKTMLKTEKKVRQRTECSSQQSCIMAISTAMHSSKTNMPL